MVTTSRALKYRDAPLWPLVTVKLYSTVYYFTNKMYADYNKYEAQRLKLGEIGPLKLMNGRVGRSNSYRGVTPESSGRLFFRLGCVWIPRRVIGCGEGGMYTLAGAIVQSYSCVFGGAGRLVAGAGVALERS